MNNYLKNLFFVNSLFCFADGLLVPLYAFFVAGIGGNAELAGILYGTKFIATTVAVSLLTKIRDRLRLDEELLKMNYLLRGACWGSLVFFPSIEMLFIAQIGIGISEAIGSPAFNSIVSENLDKQRHIQEWSFSTLTTNIAAAIASILSGFIVTFYGFSVLFAIMATVAITSFGLLHFRKVIFPKSV